MDPSETVDSMDQVVVNTMGDLFTCPSGIDLIRISLRVLIEEDVLALGVASAGSQIMVKIKCHRVLLFGEVCLVMVISEAHQTSFIIDLIIDKDLIQHLV